MSASSFSAIFSRSVLTASALVLAAAGLQAQFSASIVLPGDTVLAPPAGDQTNVAFARGGGTSLMVWEDSRVNLTRTQSSLGTSTSITDIYAARIDGAGNTLDTPPIVITHASFSQTMPKVAWNGQSWLVVWTSRTPSPFTSTQGVYAARISAAGQVLDDPPILISDTPDFDERVPVVASDGNMWAVIWHAGIAFGTDGVRGCLVSPAGTTDTPRTFFQTTGGVGYYVPSNFELAWAGGRYLFVSEHMRQSGFDNDIFGQLFDASLTKVGLEFSVSTNTWAQNRPAIAANDSGFFVTWYDAQLSGRVRGSPVSASGAVAVPDGAVYGGASYPSPAAGFDGVNWIAAWDNTGPLQVARVSPAGAMLPGSPFAAAPGTGNSSMQLPAIATLSSGVLVGWSDLRNVHFFFSNSPGIDTMDLYGAVVDANGSVAPDQPLLLSAPAQTRPDIAGNAASGYLVTYLSETAGTGSVMAQRVNALGMPIDPQPIVVTTGTRHIRSPAVAFDGTIWFVTWELLNTTGITGSANVFARRVGTNGVLIDAAPFLVLPGNTPDVAAAGGTFLVVCSSNPGHYRSITGARVRGSDGAVLDAPIFIGASYSVDPAVTAFADRWLVAWQEHPSHDSSYSAIRANFVLSSGTALGEFVAGGSPSSTSRAPSVTSGGLVALVAWSDSVDIRARRIQSDGTLLDSSTGFLVSSASNKQFAPESGWDGAQWLVAWNDYRAHPSLMEGGVGDVYGARVAADGTLQDSAGLALANDFRVPEATPAVAGDLGIAISAYALLRDDAPFGTFRITLESLGGSSAGAAFCFGDGSGTACPCSNNSPVGNEEGCLSSVGTGGKLAAVGAASLAADTIALLGTQMPNGPVLYFQGTTQLSGGAGVLFGDGLRCVGGSVIRLAPQTNVLGASQYPAAGDLSVSVQGLVTAPGVRTYQCWYRSAASFCTPNTFNLTNGWEITWVQ